MDGDGPEEKATRAMLVPTMLKWIVDNPDFDKYDLSSLNVVTYGAAPMPFEVIKKAIKIMPQVQFINGYGQTESASTLTTPRARGPQDRGDGGREAEEVEEASELHRKAAARRGHQNSRRSRARGAVETPGEIHAKGPPHHERLLGDEQKTAQTMTSDGWLRTGTWATWTKKAKYN